MGRQFTCFSGLRQVIFVETYFRKHSNRDILSCSNVADRDGFFFFSLGTALMTLIYIFLFGAWVPACTITSAVLYCRAVYDGVHHSPLRRFSKVDCSTTKRVPIPNDTSSESSTYVAVGDKFATLTCWYRHCSNCEDIEGGKSAQGGCDYTLVYGVVFASPRQKSRPLRRINCSKQRTRDSTNYRFEPAKISTRTSKSV